VKKKLILYAKLLWSTYQTNLNYSFCVQVATYLPNIFG
jgi:hypothetical protein